MQIINGQLSRPVLHLCLDMGSASWPAFNYLILGLGARGTLTWDRFHRMICDRDAGFKEAGLILSRLEMMGVLGLRRTSWGKETNHQVVLGASRDMFDMIDHTSELFEWFYADLAKDFGMMTADFGTDGHYIAVFQEANGASH